MLKCESESAKLATDCCRFAATRLQEDNILPIDKLHSKITDRAHNSHPILKEGFRILAILVGAGLVGVGLEFFLVPNGFLDGGVTGISIIVANLTGLPLGLFIAVLNVPFVVLAWKFSGFKNAARTIVGIAALSAFTLIFHHREPLTEEFVLALGYGGVLLGVGVGLALRYGGALDGIESLAHILSARTSFDVDKIILIFNFFVFVAAAFIYTPEQAMASFLLFYIVVAPMIKRMMDSSDMKTVQIISTKHAEISEMIHKELNKKVIFTDAHNDNLENDLKIVTVFIQRIEERNIQEIVEEVDEHAIIIFNDATTVKAGRL